MGNDFLSHLAVVSANDQAGGFFVCGSQNPGDPFDFKPFFSSKELNQRYAF
jgi:hypothetical protein